VCGINGQTCGACPSGDACTSGSCVFTCAGGASCATAAGGAGTCNVNGKCNASLLGGTAPIDLAVDNTNVYWIDTNAGGTVAEQAPANAVGGSLTLTPAAGIPGLVRIIPTSPTLGSPPLPVVFTSYDASTQVEYLWKATPGSMASSSELAGFAGAQPLGLAASSSGASVTFLSFDSSTVGYVPENCVVASGACSTWTPVSIGSSQPGNEMIWPSASPGYPFWTDVAAGIVYTTNGNTSVTVDSGLTSPTAMTTDGTYMYWVQSSGSFNIQRQLLTGGAITTIGTAGSVTPYQLSTDGKYVYFSGTIDGIKALLYVPVAGGITTRLVGVTVATGPVVAHTDSGGHRDVYYASGGVYVIAAPP
jgi:hypothetical protein